MQPRKGEHLRRSVPFRPRLMSGLITHAPRPVIQARRSRCTALAVHGARGARRSRCTPRPPTVTRRSMRVKHAPPRPCALVTPQACFSRTDSHARAAARRTSSSARRNAACSSATC
eukprot:353684-Chlamydomonas_euryale.AAC.7